MRALSIILAGLCLLNLGFLLRLRTKDRLAERILEDARDMRRELEGMLIEFLEHRIEDTELGDRDRARAVKYLNWMRARRDFSGRRQ